MIKDTECYKKFKRICARKENEGYSEWKKWVKNQVADYNEKEMSNLIKRYKIRLKGVSEKNTFSITGTLALYIPLFTVLITIIITITLASLNNILNIYSDYISVNDIHQYAQIVLDTMMDYMDQMLSLIARYVAILIFFVLIMHLLDYYTECRRINRKIYYEELLETLEEERRTKNEIDMQNIGPNTRSGV